MKLMARCAGAVCGLLLLAAGSSVLAGALPHPLADRCELFASHGIEDASSRSCLRCHDGSFASTGTNHPIDLDYAAAAARRAGSMIPLRPGADVVARGVFLPDGRITCVTCHDGRSRWRYGLALPPGAVPSPAVNPRDRASYDGSSAAAREAEVRAAHQQGSYGVRVSPTPLCKVCHVFN